MGRAVKAQIHGPGMGGQGIVDGHGQVRDPLRLRDLGQGGVVPGTHGLGRPQVVVLEVALDPLHKGQDPAGNGAQVVFHVHHPGPDVIAGFRVDRGGRHVLRHREQHQQRPLLLAGEGVLVAAHRKLGPAGAVVVLPHHLLHEHVVRQDAHRVVLIDDPLVEFVLGLIPHGGIDHRHDIQPQVYPGAPLAEHPVGADVEHLIGGGPPAKAIAALRQGDGDVVVGGAVRGHAFGDHASQGDAAELNGALHLGAHIAVDVNVAVRLRAKGLFILLEQPQDTALRLHPVKGRVIHPVKIPPGGPFRVPQGLGGGSLQKPGGLPQGDLQFAGARQVQHLVLGKGEPVELKVFLPGGGEEGLLFGTIQPLDPARLRVHVIYVRQAGGNGLDPVGGGKDRIGAVLFLGGGKDLRARRHRHRPAFPAGFKAHQPARRGHPRPGHAQQVEKFRIMLLRQQVEPVDGLIKHLPKQGGDGRPGVGFIPLLVAPFRDVFPRPALDQVHQVLLGPRVQDGLVHSSAPSFK